MKVNRQNDKEENSELPLWLHAFAFELEKKSKNIDYLKEYFDKQKKVKFSTIEEKLNDIRTRVGLDLALKIAGNTEEPPKEKPKEKPKCQCQENCPCQTKSASDNSDVATMGNILSFIKQVVEHEPHLDPISILNRCKTEDNLGFMNIEDKVDVKKLTDYISDLLNQKAKKENDVVYTPNVGFSEFEADDQVADYYNHAEPKHF